MFARFAEKMNAIKKFKDNFFDAVLEASLPIHKIHKSTDPSHFWRCYQMKMFNHLKNGEVLHSQKLSKTNSSLS